MKITQSLIFNEYKTAEVLEINYIKEKVRSEKAVIMQLLAACYKM